VSNRAAKFEIFTMTATGGNQTQLTKNKKNDVDPSYSPSGQTITFSSNQGTHGPANKQEIFVMNASDGGSPVRLTTIQGYDRAPLYLDAGHIVFQSATFGGGGLAIVAPTGGTVTKIPDTVQNDATPG
jgi:TolB protein